VTKYIPTHDAYFVQVHNIKYATTSKRCKTSLHAARFILHTATCFAGHGGLTCPHKGCNFSSKSFGPLARHSRTCQLASQEDTPWELDLGTDGGFTGILRRATEPGNRKQAESDWDWDNIFEVGCQEDGFNELAATARPDDGPTSRPDDGSARRVRFTYRYVIFSYRHA